MHSVTDRQTDGQQDDANSRSYCVAVRSAKNPRKVQEHIEHCNLAWIFFIKRITVTFVEIVVADGPLTSINQTCASILAVVCVLLGRAVTEYRWGGSRNILFMRHKLLVLTVKKMLKLVYIYGSYRKIKTGVSLFWTTRYIWQLMGFLWVSYGFLSYGFLKILTSISVVRIFHVVLFNYICWCGL